MDKMEEFLENFKKILLAVKNEHEFVNTTTCVCGHKVQDVIDWDQHVVDAQARKLIEFLWEK